MNTPHAHRTEAQQLAIKKTLAKMQEIHPATFGMQVGLQINLYKNGIKGCNSYGGIAGYCIIANLGILKASNPEIGNVINCGAKLMGLTDTERSELLEPNTPDAYYASRWEGRKTHIDLPRATLAVKYFYFVGTIEWNKEKLIAWDKKQKANNLPEALK